jgi:hypothetical protein
MKLYLILLLTGCASCGSPEEVITDASLKGYANEIMEWCQPDNMCHYHSKMESIKFGKTASHDVIGMCHVEVDGLMRESRRIVINRTFWKDATRQERLELMAHELAHCNWDAEHVDDKASLMHPEELHPHANIRQLFLDWYFSTVKRQRTSPVEQDVNR